MPKFAANLTTLLNELPFLDRFAAARAHGFEGVELLFPYSIAPQDIQDKLDRYGLTLVQFNLPPGDWAAGDRGLAVDPSRRAEFRESVELAIAYANQLGVRQLHCMAGIGNDHATYVDNLRRAAGQCAAHGIRLMIEPINPFDMPGYFLTHCDQAAHIIAEVGAPNLLLQYDIYHMERMGVDHASALNRLMPDIGHMQLADVPGRHEPGTGTIDWASLFQHIDRLGYDGWIGCEYMPTQAGFGWRERFL